MVRLKCVNFLLVPNNQLSSIFLNNLAKQIIRKNILFGIDIFIILLQPTYKQNIDFWYYQ